MSFDGAACGSPAARRLSSAIVWLPTGNTCKVCDVCFEVTVDRVPVPD
ncbi:hypothetical protein [Terrabacter carboxydivorans]